MSIAKAIVCVAYTFAIISGGWPVAVVAQNQAALQPPHDPMHAAGASDWCAAHLARKELVAALSDCDFAVSATPKSVQALSNRGSVWLLAGEPARALRDFQEALTVAPDDATLYFNRGLARAKLGARDMAIADYSEAIQRKPDFAIAFHNRGYEFEVQGMTEQAMTDYRRALELSPGLRPATDAINRLSRGRLSTPE